MDPALVIFGFGIGVLVGMTGMGGGSLMTPMLILLFGIKPVTAIGTDIFYAAVTKTVGGWRHLRKGTVNLGLTFWMALGSVPASIAGVWLISILQDRIGQEELDSIVYALLGGTLLMVGIITLARALILSNLIEERDEFEIKRRHKVAAVVIGATCGFVIGVTSAGSGTVIAILLIAIYRLAPQRVVGTDVFHAAILLWAAGLAHWVGGNVDFALAGNILLGSVPGVVVGAHFATRAPTGFLRTALGAVLVASGIVTVQKGDPVVWPIAAAVAGIGLLGLIWAPRWYAKRRDAALEEERRREPGRDRTGDPKPEGDRLSGYSASA
ncbi:MAG TPA: sulfite exporter TauE/SafE family protein [Solirubrobacterales bacterium]|nr:sulfite exporter TauE/SafE family protein [Solirubrobacterales bacterium]